jgi:cytochrome c oxidase assembly protein subunit 15
MVRSGLEHSQPKEREVRVSQYRLAAHLTMATVIYIITLATAFRLWPARAGSLLERPACINRRLLGWARAAKSLLGLTIVSGAFVAGTRAGLIYNEYPLMGGRIVPSDIVDKNIAPAWKNAFENPSAIQFHHRVLSLSTLIACLVFVALARKAPLHYGAAMASRAVGVAASGQVSVRASFFICRRDHLCA